jgi:D-alanyl-D-alanine carboxypeptidase
MNIKRATAGFLLSFVFLFVFVYMISGVQWLFENSSKISAENNFSASVLDSAGAAVIEDSTSDVIQQIPAPEINAESAITVESNLSESDKVLFSKNSDVQLPIASLTKLMTAIVVLENYNLSEIITVGEISDAQDPMKQDVKLGDKMPVESFLDIMLVKSSNKAAYALAEAIGEPNFVSLMNKKAKEIGLANTYFADPTGLSAQNISTASDLSKLAKYILKNYTKISDISRTKEITVPNFGKVENTNELLGEIPEIVCGKTGFTTQAKGCLLLVINNPKNNGYLINIILGADDRFLEMKKLINWSNLICK